MRLKSTINLFSRMPIKWKLTIWSSFILFVLFMAYNAVQYVYMEKWMMNQEKVKIQANMNQLLNELLENEYALQNKAQASIRQLFYRINEPNQLIRLMDQHGEAIVTVSSHVSDEWVKPHSVTKSEIVLTEVEGRSLLVMRSPITVFQFNGTIEIVKSMDDFTQLSAAFTQMMLIFGLVAVVLCGLGGGILAWQMLKPIQSMALTIRKVKQKGLQERVPIQNKGDEVGKLIVLFNEMMDQVEQSFLQQTQFVEDASHELRTPIAIIEGHLGLLQRWGKNEPAVLEESLQASMQELLRLKGLVQELLELNRAEHLDGEPYRTVSKLGEGIQSLIQKLVLIHPAFQFETEVASVMDTSLAIGEQHFEQVMLIVLDNAVKYSLSEASVHIKALAHEDTVQLIIKDKGIGIPEEHLPYVTDRFYRVEQARSRERGGNGLGLSIAKRIVEKYDGELLIQSEYSKGTEVTISLPIASRSKSSERLLKE
ncbi:HAMP domain-containing sensor histidine kinase [Paenibacillus agilis]|uniref:Signal transduction histidine-protein kinase ArlS n=1 Tax=Paenibacillus agilis TaxID=3020863 RepID=A0A559J198_9BACL|nr:HAMP domain-containing histidine kinase [Paenibacillus agilis]TVX93659.1 HAMP domain-containing histidine kinase [Paenibacillus agilis]